MKRLRPGSNRLRVVLKPIEFVMSVPGMSLISVSIDKFQCEKRRDYD